MDPETFDLVTKGGALAVLLYLIPVLRSIAASLAAIAALAVGMVAGLRDAGVPIADPPTVQGAVAATVRHLKNVATVLLLAVLFVGCSCTGAVRDGLGDLERDFDLYRGASVARVESQTDLHREMGRAVKAHITEARRLADR